MKKNINVLVIAVSSPLFIGIYDENYGLIETIEKDGKTSDILPSLFKDILLKYSVGNLYYTNGPGSYMAIKVAYMFLKSISITKNIELFGCSAFSFNGNSPIKALGKKYFFNSKDGNITIDFLKENDKIEEFRLPNILDVNIFTKESLPTYNLPAVN